MPERRIRASYGRTWGLPNYSSERYDISFEGDIGPSANRDNVAEDLFAWAKRMVHDAHAKAIPEAEFTAAGGTVERKGDAAPAAPQGAPQANGNGRDNEGPKASEKQVAYIYKLASQHEQNQKYLDELLVHLKLERADQLSLVQASRFIEAVRGGR